MEKDWVKIFSSPDYYRSEMIKQALADHDIDSVLINKKASSHPTFGDIEIYIHQSDFSDALEVIVLNQINL